MTTEKKIDWGTVEIDGIDTRDYPDFCDAFILYGEYEDGTVMTEDEMDEATERFADKVNERAFMHYVN